MPVSVLVSCGSNIDPEENLQAGLKLLKASCDIRATSRIFMTRAAGGSRMPDFHNAAVEVLTGLSAAELKFGVLRGIEAQLGRSRSEDRNAPRSLDLDVSLFGNEVIQNEPLGLWLPDAEILTRVHVALTLAEIAPDRRYLATGETPANIAERLLTRAAPDEIRPA